MKTINLTQHAATTEQVAAGVFDLETPFRERLCALLTFEELPTRAVLSRRAEEIRLLAFEQETPFDAAMIGGAPFFMEALATALREETEVVYAFSRRESVETVQPDGSVKKTAVFRHAGFVNGGAFLPESFLTEEG